MAETKQKIVKRVHNTHNDPIADGEVAQCTLCPARITYGGMIESRGRTLTHWICPCGSYGWHRQADALMKLADETPSAIMAAALRVEAVDIITTRKATIARYEK